MRNASAPDDRRHDRQPDFAGFRTTAAQLRRRHAGQLYDRDRPVRLVHVVNPVNLPETHELARAQRVTYLSMRHALAYAATVDPAARIELVATQFPEDAPAVPDGFVRLPDLSRDSSQLAAFRVPRRLPLVFEIISRAREFARADAAAGTPTYLAFTNVDIALLPHFYAYVAWLVRRGHDAAIINRRSIADHEGGAHDLPAMLSDYGMIHPGLDCFILDAGIVDRFVPFQSIVGMDLAMRALYFNMVALARNPVLLTDVHATFHIGLDGEWAQGKYADYAQFNRAAWLQVIDELCKDPEIERRLRQFVRATAEHRLLPNGVLGVRRPWWDQPLRSAVRRGRRWLRQARWESGGRVQGSLDSG